LQKKIQPKRRGVGTLFKKDALRFVLKWPVKGRAAISGIYQINNYAGSPNLWAKMFAKDFAEDYAFSPDLFAALLNFLRGKWRALEKSKAGKLKKFIAENMAVKWDESFASRAAVEEANKIRTFLSEREPKVPPGGRAVTKEDEDFILMARTMWAKRQHRSGVVPDKFGNVSAWDLQDKEIKTAFEKSPGGFSVSIADVVKARKWVAKHQFEGDKFEANCVSAEGYIYLKKRARRPKINRKRARK
jgi:hypothetical protein